MNDKTKQALELALEALTKHSDRVTEIRTKDDAITAIREALAEQTAQQQEPVAWIVWNGWRKVCVFFTHEGAEDFRAASQRNDDLSGNLAAYRVAPLYHAPPRKTLTDDELSHTHDEYHDQYGQPINSAENGWAYERAIIRAACGITGEPK